MVPVLRCTCDMQQVTCDMEITTFQSASLAAQLGVQLAGPAVAWPAPAQKLARLLGAHAPGFGRLTHVPCAAFLPIEQAEW